MAVVRMNTGLAVLALAATSLAPGESLAELRARADSQKARGDAAAALATLQTAAALAPASGEIQGEIGFLLAVLKRAGEAKVYFRRAIELQQEYAPAHYHLGMLLWLEQDPNSAIPLPARTALTPRQKARLLALVLQRRYEVS